jgi:hypothetical protein
MFTIMLPYCNESGIPVLARHLQRIRLMQDFHSMITLIHGNTLCLFARSFWIRRALLREIHSSLKTNGDNLKNSIAKMENIINENVKNGCELKDPVYEELKLQMETQVKSQNLGNSVFEITNSEELCNENSTLVCHLRNDEEFRISCLDLTGEDSSFQMEPRKSHCSVRHYEFCCDNLRL